MSNLVMQQWQRITAPARQRLAPKWQTLQVEAQQRWQRLQPREQRVLQMLLVFLSVIVLWLGIWQPLQERIARAEARLAAEYSTQRYVEQQLALVQQARSSSQGNIQRVQANDLSGVVSSLASNLQIEVSRIQPQGEALVLVLNEVEFNRLLQLLAQLVERGVVIEAFDASETNEPGIVRVRRLQVRV